MNPALNPVWIAVLVVPVAIMMVAAIVAEQRRRRRDHTDGVLITWDDLRLTRTHLIVGSRRDAQRIPLGGLHAVVDVTASPDQADDKVCLSIENAGHDIRRSQPYSWGASGNAQMFAITFNTLSGQPDPASAQPDTDVESGGSSDRRAA